MTEAESEAKFSTEELSLILDQISHLSSDKKDCVGRCLAAKKSKGVPINKQAIAICMSECGRTSESKNSDKTTSIPRKVGLIRFTD